MHKGNRIERLKWSVIEDAPAMNPLLVIGYLADSFSVPFDRRVHLNKCKRACDRLGVSWDMVQGPSRLRQYVTVRHMCFKYLRDEGWTFRAIGKAFNDRDHATARHGCIQAENYLETDRDFLRSWLTFLQS